MATADVGPILAMAPPCPIGVKLFVALLMLGLAGLLVRKLRGGPFTPYSIGLAVVSAMAVVIGFQVAIPSSYGGGFHDRGVLAAVVGALSAILLRPVCPSSAQRRRVRTLRLSAMAIISGPLMGLLLATLTVLLSDVPRVDRAYTFGMFALIGTVAGVIGAGVLAVVSLSSSRHPPEDVDAKMSES